jgi:hypothetical protein
LVDRGQSRPKPEALGKLACFGLAFVRHVAKLLGGFGSPSTAICRISTVAFRRNLIVSRTVSIRSSAMHGSANPLLPQDLAERAISQSLITIRFVQTRPDVANLCWSGGQAPSRASYIRS